MSKRFERERRILLSFCQTQGLHHSGKREAVLETFLAAEHHLTAEELHERMLGQRIAVDLKTVNSALELMVGAGLARVIRLDDGIARYEHAFAHRHHDHLICRTCGKMIEFANAAIELLQEEIATAHHFVVEDHSLSIYGICEACTAKAKVTSPPPLSKDEREQLVVLAKLKPGQHGIVREIQGGEALSKRLAAMGIRPGKQITKVSAMLMGGPVVVSIDRRQLALGNGMAHKVLVDTKL